MRRAFSDDTRPKTRLEGERSSATSSESGRTSLGVGRTWHKTLPTWINAIQVLINIAEAMSPLPRFGLGRPKIGRDRTTSGRARPKHGQQHPKVLVNIVGIRLRKSARLCIQIGPDWSEATSLSPLGQASTGSRRKCFKLMGHERPPDLSGHADPASVARKSDPRTSPAPTSRPAIHSSDCHTSRPTARLTARPAARPADRPADRPAERLADHPALSRSPGRPTGPPPNARAARPPGLAAASPLVRPPPHCPPPGVTPIQPTAWRTARPTPTPRSTARHSALATNVAPYQPTTPDAPNGGRIGRGAEAEADEARRRPVPPATRRRPALCLHCARSAIAAQHTTPEPQRLRGDPGGKGQRAMRWHAKLVTHLESFSRNRWRLPSVVVV